MPGTWPRAASRRSGWPGDRPDCSQADQGKKCIVSGCSSVVAVALDELLDKPRDFLSVQTRKRAANEPLRNAAHSFSLPIRSTASSSRGVSTVKAARM